jgi:RNA polymerase sigma-54 factor
MLDNPLLEQSEEDRDQPAKKDNKEDVQDYMSLDEYMHDDIPDYKMEYRNYISNEGALPVAADHESNFRDDLKSQFRLEYPDDKEYAIADFLIDSLNDDGILDLDIDEACEYLSFLLKIWVEREEAEGILKKLQELGPAGIAARNLQECFLLKLGRLHQNRPDVKKAICLVKDHFKELHAGNIEKIREKLGLDEGELKIILKLLADMRTKPSVQDDNGINPSNYITPDFFIQLVDGSAEIALLHKSSSGLFINQSWIEKVQGTEEARPNKEVRQYVRSKLQSAQWFIHAVKERESNMMKIMKCIVDIQHDYFQEGDIMKLKPMILKTVAERTSLDISTVSRIISNKYAETPFGIIALKRIFSEGFMDEDGSAVSNKVIQKIISDMVEREDKKRPLRDQEIVKMLKEKGFQIARRTVAKYRDQLGIPMAQHRGLIAEIA